MNLQLRPCESSISAPRGFAMMNSLHFGLALIAILMILYWYIQNDGDGQDDGTTGFLAMKTGKPKAAAPERPCRNRSFRRKGRK